MRVLHLSDVHLGADLASFGPLADARRQEILDAFQALPDLAEAEGVHAVFIAGDLFDTPRPNEYTLSLVRRTIRRLTDSGRPVCVVAGHHDAAYANPALWRDTLHPAVVLAAPSFVDPVVVPTQAGPVQVRGFSYDWGAVPEPLDTYRPARAPHLEVMLVHGALPIAPEWHLHPLALRLPIEWLVAVQSDYIALGGFHEFRAPYDFDVASRIPACYPGSFASLDSSELAPRGVVIAEIEVGRPPRLERRESAVAAVRDLGRLDIGRYADEQAVASGVLQRLPVGALPVVTLAGEPSFALDAAAVVNVLEPSVGRAFVDDDTWMGDAAVLDALAHDDTVAGHVVRLGRARIAAAKDADTRMAAERALRTSLRALGAA